MSNPTITIIDHSKLTAKWWSTRLSAFCACRYCVLLPEHEPIEHEPIEIVKAPEVPEHEATRVEAEDDRPPVGSWFWAPAKNDEHADRPKQILMCVVEVGSNYVKLSGVHYTNWRISVDFLREECTPEPNPHVFIDMKVAEHKGQVRQLMGEIQRVCHQLGVPMHQALAAPEAASQALATTSGVANVKRYGKALAKAKDKTLPELFKKVKEQHEQLAIWMKAELIPAQAELTRAKEVTSKIEDKIHTVELYAGLQEKLVQIREGEPADANERVKLMQRRCYMDEECLANYDAGGMDFKGIGAFDKWIRRDDNMRRILPHERCIVAFRVRRTDKDYYDGDDRVSLSDHIRFYEFNEANKMTFLYIRNGKQLWRMMTSIDFGAELFPRREDSDLLGDDQLYVKPGHSPDFITARAYHAKIEEEKQWRRDAAKAMWAWKRAGKPKDKWQYEGKNLTGSPRKWPFGDYTHRHHFGDDWRQFEPLTPESIYYDDAMKTIARAAFEHNRIAVVIQGLLDRSTCLHPHAPWKLWTPEGFAAGIELVFDYSLAITPGEMPDWEGYRAQLNKSLRVGAVTIGQRRAWHDEMEEKYASRRRYDWPAKEGSGPATIDTIRTLRGGKASFTFTRSRTRAVWVDADRPGYIKKSWPDIEMSWLCPLDELTCIDAYTPGDYHMFFDDPRTRAKYLQWAPILLKAEDYHAKRRTAPDKLVDGDAPTTVYEADPEPAKEKAMIDDIDDDDEDEFDDDDDDDDDIDDDDDDDDGPEPNDADEDDDGDTEALEDDDA